MTEGPRGRFAEELNAELADVAAVAIPVRGRVFENQNAILGDVSKILRKNRTTCEAGLALARLTDDAICIAMVASSPLGLSQSSSGVQLPEWFPVYGGTEPIVQIEDLSKSPTTRLNDPIANIAGLSRALYELEGAILDRMAQLGADGSDLSELLAPGLKVHAFADWQGTHRQVRDPGGFRPSTRDTSSLVGGIWRFAQRTAEEARLPVVSKLAETLTLPSEAPIEWTEGILAVLARPAARRGEFGSRFARALIAEVAGTCQYVTSAAHSAEYHLYSVSLIGAFSAELQRGLSEDARILRILN